MKLSQTIAAAPLVSALMISLSGCEKQGPLDEAGEEIDDKVEGAGDATDGG